MKELHIEDFQYLTVKRDLDEKWFYNTGCQYPLICPKGTRVKFISVVKNYYGVWFEVEYNGKIKYGLPDDFEGNVFVNSKHYASTNVVSLKTTEYYILTDRYGQKYIYNETEGKLELSC